MRNSTCELDHHIFDNIHTIYKEKYSLPISTDDYKFQ